MSVRKRTSKSVAKRHNLDYFKKGSPIRLWQWRLAAVALGVAVIWIGLSSWHSANAFSAGPISAQHAIFGQRCEVCHKPLIPGAGWLPVIGARRTVPDSACMSCHKVGPHHADVAGKTAACSSCHIEHIGAMHLAAAPVRGCTQCHTNLETSGRPPEVAAHIVSFTQGHPGFRLLPTASPADHEAAFGLKFNHAEHMQPGLSKPDGSKTTLQCSSCHTLSDLRVSGSGPTDHMVPVDFDRSCRVCHSLDFDARVHEQAPHTFAPAVLQFVQQKMAAVAPGDQAALVKAETIVFREKCSLCHTVSGAQALPHTLNTALEAPQVAPFTQPEQFFSESVFSHSAHSAVQCSECHSAALTSNNGKDILLPSIATCQRCHDGMSNPQGTLPSGHAESGCSLCHLYHEGGRLHANSTQPPFRIDDLAPKR